MVNGDFPSLPDEGVIAWKIDAKRPPHKVTFKITKFTELTSLPSQNGSERPSLLDAELLKAEIKFESAMRRADDVLMKHFDPEINKLQHSKNVEDKNLVPVLEHEKELLKDKGLIPWSRPMRKAVSQFGKELRDARRTIGIAFDRAIDRAEKNHNDKLKEALLTEAAQVLAPREVATWQITDKQGVAHRNIFYSDGTFIAADKPDETNSRFWEPRFEDVIILEFPDQNDSTATNQQAFVLAPDGKTLVTTAKNGEKRTWQHVED